MTEDKQEPLDDAELAQRLVAQARSQGVSLTGPGGLLGDLTKRVLETALEGELDEHLGYIKGDPAGVGSVTCHWPGKGSIVAGDVPLRSIGGVGATAER